MKSYHIISIDLKGSSEILTRTPDEQYNIFSLIRFFIEKYSIKNSGSVLYWYGDGGIVLFEIESDKKFSATRKRALQFSLGVVKFSGYLSEFLAKPNSEIEDPIERAVYFERVIDKYLNVKANLCNKVWETDEIFNSPTLLNGIINFRIALHTGKIDIRKTKDDKFPLALGAELSFIAKYEREFTVENCLVASGQFLKYKKALPIDFDGNIDYARKNIDEEDYKFSVHPPEKKPLLQFKVETGLSASIFNSASKTGIKNLLLKFEDCIGHLKKQSRNVDIKLYNISLVSFQNGLGSFWKTIVKDYDVSARIILRKDILYLNENILAKTVKDEDKIEVVNKSLHNAKKLVYESIEKGIENFAKNEENTMDKSIIDDILKKIKIRFVQSYSDIDRDSHKESFGHSFGCSIIESDDVPIEGTTFFLTNPFCSIKRFNQKDVLDYNRLFYFSDVYSKDYLAGLSKKFEDYWDNDGDTDDESPQTLYDFYYQNN
jgi:hypothetical protein